MLGQVYSTDCSGRCTDCWSSICESSPNWGACQPAGCSGEVV